ncbi:membrane protein insertase YidC [Frankia sp. Cas3]|uniref:membrane protein insertase YidC n=1 Tax=Frankia sp. Cas3 TaxID=3073926 RepID=UPI002AD37CF7|nr:membrane protein insertase YidC [Frankia sp. Cas3]
MLNPLYHLAAHAIVFFHGGFGLIFGQGSFFAWSFSVVLLVICVRILIFPLFVRQVKSQRTMQLMQPKIKEIREKHGHDKQKMNAEIMALQKEHGNPLLGCLPIVLQIPLFIALFHVFSHLQPVEGKNGLEWVARVGLTAHQVQQIAEAKLLGVSLSTSFTSSSSFLEFVRADGTNVKIFAVVLILLMGMTTFLTQKQIMARTGTTDSQQAMVQKVLLYGSPIMLAVFGFRFPIAVLLYWLTTNLWSMGQQFFVIKRMPPVLAQTATGRVPGARVEAGSAAKGKTLEPPARPAPGARPVPGARPAAKAKSRSKPAVDAPTTESSATAVSKAANKSTGKAPPGTRSPGNPGSKARPATAAGNGSGAASGNGTGGNTVGNWAGDNVAGNGTGGSAAGKVQPAPAPVPENGAVQDNRTASEGEPKTRAAGTPGVPAGARRPSGGSRPAKRRGKGGRPGGRR